GKSLEYRIPWLAERAWLRCRLVFCVRHDGRLSDFIRGYTNESAAAPLLAATADFDRGTSPHIAPVVYGALGSFQRRRCYFCVMGVPVSTSRERPYKRIDS